MGDVNKIGLEILNAIDDTFKSYGLIFKWDSGYFGNPYPVRVNHYNGIIEFSAMGVNDEIISQMEGKSDCQIFARLIWDVLSDYLKNNKIDLKVVGSDYAEADIDVYIDSDYDERSDGDQPALFVEFWLEDKV